MTEAAAEGMNQSIHDLEKPTAPERTSAPDEEPTPDKIDKSIRDILLQIKQANEDSSRDHLQQMRQLLVQDEVGANMSIKAFDWMKCKPTRLFYPVSNDKGSWLSKLWLKLYRHGGYDPCTIRLNSIRPSRPRTCHFEKMYGDILLAGTVCISLKIPNIRPQTLVAKSLQRTCNS